MKMLDVQGSTITHSHAIQNVGVSGLEYPFTPDLGDGDAFRTSAVWSLGVSLSAEQRGAHMSRFVETVDTLGDRPISISGMVDFVQNVRQTLEASRASCEVRFTWFRRVYAPVSRKSALNPHQITWRIDCDASGGGDGGGDGGDGGGAAQSRAFVTVQLPVKSLCPCSKAISERGAHNQRSLVTVTIRSSADAASLMPSIEKMVAMVESHASSPVYPILKRADEKFVTELAYDNPGFVEDLIRSIAGSLGGFTGVEAFKLHVRNQESIHAHDCFAEITSPYW